jgi:hypothetical protein
MGALLRDVEVYISQDNSLTAHALNSSIEEASKQVLWNLHQKEKIPNGTSAAHRANLINIPGKKTLVFQDSVESSPTKQISYDHTHTMENVIKNTCKLGFMLRDINDELGSRFIDELLILDKNAKELASPRINTRHSLGASLGAGSDTFVQYSMLGHTYTLLQVIIEEAKKSAMSTNTTSTNDNLEEILTNTSIYRRLNCFKNEISVDRLTNAAKRCFKKLREDYKIGSFIHLMEWRCKRSDLDNHCITKPLLNDYTEIIDDENTYQPSVEHTANYNCKQLSAHLRRILCLSHNNIRNTNNDERQDTNRLISDDEIITYATRHDLPICVSIDGSLKEGCAIVSMCIVAPDIRHMDNSSEWQSRPAIALLIRSWRLPKQWGTGSTCINMAETVGFIIGEYTVPPDIPILYITDSNNARTLQRNLKYKDDITHRKMIRRIKQGIDHAIANHLEYFTDSWQSKEQLEPQAIDAYERGEAICQEWASKKYLNGNETYIDDDTETLNSDAWSVSTYHEMEDTYLPSSHSQSHSKNRYTFDHSMYDCLERVIILKVFSHQLNSDFTVKTLGEKSKPNIFAVSANQIADNAA